MKTIRISLAAASNTAEAAGKFSRPWKVGDRFAVNWGEKGDNTKWWLATVKKSGARSVDIEYDTGDLDTYTVTYMNGHDVLRLVETMPKSTKPLPFSLLAKNLYSSQGKLMRDHDKRFSKIKRS